MTDYYAIRQDGFDYMMLRFGKYDLIDMLIPFSDLGFDDVADFSLLSTRLKPHWEKPEVEFTENDQPDRSLVPDIGIWPAGAGLVLNPRAYRLLGDILSKHGELLPVFVKSRNEEFWIFNCLHTKNADPNLSEWEYEGETPIQIKSLGFSSDDSDAIIFKTPFNNCSTLFCSDAFKTAIEEYELKGIKFSSNLVSDFPI